MEFTKHVEHFGLTTGFTESTSIGILASCGVNSSLLLYQLLTETTADIHVYSFLEDKNKSVVQPQIDRLFARICERAERDIILHKINDWDDAFSTVYLFDYCVNKLNLGEVSEIYSGFTHYPPPTEITDKWPEMPSYLQELRTSDTPISTTGIELQLDTSEWEDGVETGLLSPYTVDERIYFPWINDHKQKLRDVYAIYDILWDIFPLTKSCNLEYRDPNGIDNNCGNCFKCWERSWAFGATTA